MLQARQASKSSYLYTIVVFALAIGARQGEIVNLKWEDVNFVRVTASFRSTENGEARTIALSSTVLDCLRQEQKRCLVLSPHVFPSIDGNDLLASEQLGIE